MTDLLPSTPPLHPASKTFQIEFVASDALFSKAAHVALEARYGRHVLPVFWALSGLGVLGILVSFGDGDAGMTLLCILATFCTMLLPFQFYYGRHKTLAFFRKHPDRRRHVEITREGMRFESTFGQGLTRWKSFTRVFQGPNVWLFYLTPTRAVYVPVPVSVLSTELQDFISDCLRREHVEIKKGKP